MTAPPGLSRRAGSRAVERTSVSPVGVLASRSRRDYAAGPRAVDLTGVAVPAHVKHRRAEVTADLAEAVGVTGDETHPAAGANLTTRRCWSLTSAARRRKIMARRSKLNPAEKQRRQAKREELDRLESITGMTQRLTCLDSLACQAVNDCERYVEDLEFDLATSRLAVEFWAEHPAAQ
ncbi:MAG: hypothetical protein ABIY55_08970, partial [Kofleriaceae bacterium]